MWKELASNTCCWYKCKHYYIIISCTNTRQSINVQDWGKTREEEIAHRANLYTLAIRTTERKVDEHGIRDYDAGYLYLGMMSTKKRLFN